MSSVQVLSQNLQLLTQPFVVLLLELLQLEAILLLLMLLTWDLSIHFNFFYHVARKLPIPQ